MWIQCVVSGIVTRPPHAEVTHVSTSRTCECVSLHDKRDFADVTKDLEVGTGSWLVSWAQCHHEGPGKREAGGSEKGDVRIKQRVEGQALKIRL